MVLPKNPVEGSGDSNPYDSNPDGSSRRTYSDGSFHRYKPFFDSVRSGKRADACGFLRSHPEAIRIRNPRTGKIALHVAAIAGHTEIAKELINLMTGEDLEVQGFDGFTPLIDAIHNGDLALVKCMVEKNSKTIEIATKNGMIPIAIALMWGYREIGCYLYDNKPPDTLLRQPATNGATILSSAIRMKEFDIALNMLHDCQQLAFAQDLWKQTPLFALACTASAFPSGSKLKFWQKWISHSIHNQVRDRNSHDHPIQVDEPDNITYSASFQKLKSTLSTYILPGTLKHINELKLIHIKSLELLSKFCDIINRLEDYSEIQYALHEAIFEATDRGIVEFIVYLANVNQDILTWCIDPMGMNIFMSAIKSRQANICSLLCYGLHSKEIIIGRVDDFENNALHMAGSLPPSSALHNKAGAALQMQRELQWFKEIEKIMPPQLSESKNNLKMTPRETFSETHRDLMIEGEKWMKETASFCIVASALVVTIMFAAAITIPGGNNQEKGVPIFLHKRLFRVFMISDILSVFSSTISVLEFLGVITSRYAEEDFLRALPTRMTIGVACLLFSIATMMVAFCAVIFTMFEEDLGITILIGVLALFPIGSFFGQLLPLLFEIFVSTYRPSIFNKKCKLEL